MASPPGPSRMLLGIESFADMGASLIVVLNGLRLLRR